MNTVQSVCALSIALWACSPTGPGPVAGGSVDGSGVPTGKLPRQVLPVAYRIDLDVNPDIERFAGRVVIEVDIAEPVDAFWIHGRQLEVSRAEVRLPAEGTTIKGRYRQVTDDGVSRVQLESVVQPQRAELVFEYTGAFDQRLEGLYRVEEGGRWYAFSQFESIDARQCFPSFDEPAFKTPLQLSIITSADHRAVASSPEVSSKTLSDGRIHHQFAPTKSLPTYLLALAVGPFDIVEAPPIPSNAVRKHPVPFRGIAVKGRGDKLQYALKHTGRFIEILEEYFGIGYPFAKLDVIAVPDFAFGAMENVGLITFREVLLLLDDDAPAHQKRGFAHVMAHELAHQWFGNLVTMPWWDDIWLNEAFATWVGHRAVDVAHPSYKAPISFLEDVLSTMEDDSRVSARQIRQPIQSNHDIANAFDSITYDKGGGVLSMFERFLGPDRFRAGIKRYLETYSYVTADSHQFLAALSQGAGRDITPAFESFLTQPGVPLVSVTPSCGEGRGAVAVTQSRFLPVGSLGDPNRLWQFPVCLKYSIAHKVHEQCTLVTKRATTITLEQPGCPDWILPNADGAGYYRWTMPAAEMKKLREVAFSKLTTRDLLSVGDSLRSSVIAAKLPIGDAFEFVDAFARHPERAVAKVPMDLVRFSLDRLVAEDQSPRVEAFGRRVYARAFERLGLEPNNGRSGLWPRHQDDDDDETWLFRRDLVTFMTDVGRHADLRRYIADRGKAFIGLDGNGELDPQAIDANLAAAALSVAVEEGDAPVLDSIVAHLQQVDDPSIRRQLVQALSRAVKPELAARVRQLALDPLLRSNEVYRLLRDHMEMRQNRLATWTWLTQNFDALVERLPPFRSGRLPWIGSVFCSTKDAQMVRAFFASRIEHLQGGPRNLAGALEGIELCAARVEAQRQSARQFFDTVKN